MHASKFTRRATFALALGSTFLVGPLTAGAVEATQAEADRIRNSIEDYIGHPDPGAPRIVDVLPKGDAYDLIIDVDPWLAALKTPGGFEMKLGRVTSRLEPLPDGTWRQSIDSFPTMLFSAGGGHSEGRYEGLFSEGVFDPAKLYFPRTTMRAARLSFTSEHPKDEKGTGAAAEVVEEGLDFVATAAPATTGTGVDVAISQKVAKITETVRTTGAAESGIPDMTFTFATSDHVSDMHIDGFRNREALDLWKWAVANHGFEAAKTDPAAFKQRLAALGPLFDRFGGTSLLQNIGVETPFGFGGATTVKVAMDTTGLGRDGRFDFGFDLTELKLHTMLAPAWAIRLLPTDITLRTRAEGWNLADAVSAWLGIVDFANPRPLTPEETARLTALVLPKGTASVDLTGNHVKGALWDVALDGRLDAGPAGAKGDVTIRATGLDAVTAALSEPRDANAQQALGALSLATTLAVREGDAHVWRFAFDGDVVTLNGKPFGPQKKAEPTPEKPQADEPTEPKKKKNDKPGDMPHPKKLLQQKI